MKTLDLTYPIEEGMTTFASHWHPLVEITQIGRLGFEGRETRKVTFGTHTGTHMDAPLHFVKGGRSIDQISTDKFIGKVTILDFSFLKNNEAVTAKMLENIELEKKVIFKFGWGKYWGSNQFYNDYPYFSEEAANYLVDKKVELIALDTPSPDDSSIKLEKMNLGTEKDSPIHKIFLSCEIILVEYLANLDKIDDLNNWNIAVFPLKIKGGDGSPIRACIFK